MGFSRKVKKRFPLLLIIIVIMIEPREETKNQAEMTIREELTHLETFLGMTADSHVNGTE